MLNGGLDGLATLSNVKSRMVTAENVYGEKGRGGMAEVGEAPQQDVVRIGQPWDSGDAARELGCGWKVRPCIRLPEQSETVIMDVEGPGVIRHIWITVNDKFNRALIVRMFWDDEPTPSVECPLGDFFCNAWQSKPTILALPINVNPTNGMNCYFPMPFRKRARIVVQNMAPEPSSGFFYAISYSLEDVTPDQAAFHAMFRRENPLRYGNDYVMADGIRGRGHYVGAYMGWQQNSSGWWGEGEIKFFMDGDKDFPTLCGTGTEDYFGGAWSFQDNFSAPYLGYPVGQSDGRPGNRHGLYRFHVLDPIHFEQNLKVTMQALGWRSERRYLPLQDDICSVVYWYQAEPHASFPALPDRNGLEII